MCQIWDLILIFPVAYSSRIDMAGSFYSIQCSSVSVKQHPGQQQPFSLNEQCPHWYNIIPQWPQWGSHLAVRHAAIPACKFRSHSNHFGLNHAMWVKLMGWLWLSWGSVWPVIRRPVWEQVPNSQSLRSACQNILKQRNESQIVLDDASLVWGPMYCLPTLIWHRLKYLLLPVYKCL